MENQILKAHFLGCYSFKSKDKTKDYYKLQAVAYSENSTKALIIDTFVSSENYEKLYNLEYFTLLDLQIVPNLSNNSLSYKLLF